MQTICGIYKITNLINNKIYIGQSVDIYDRWVKHKAPSKAKYHLQLAFEKYGIENFKFEIIEECPPEKLDEREIYWIAYFDSYENGYNETRGGQGWSKYDYEELYRLWQDGLNCKEIQEYLCCGDEVITRALAAYGLSKEEIRSRSQIKIPVVAIDINSGKPLKVFESIRQAWLFFHPNIIGEGQLLKAITQNLRSNGYYWQELNDKNHPLKELTDKEFLSYQAKPIKIYTSENKEQISLRNRQVDRPSREVLKQLIYELPFTTIGKQYNVCDNTIRKWCMYYKLPYKKSEIKNYSKEEWILI